MVEFPIPHTWDRAGLEQLGFTGFVPIVGLDLTQLPNRRGIYAVLRESLDEPSFVDENPIIRPRRYTSETLRRKWLTGHTIVYIGKADPVDGIYGRLGAFSKRSSSHSGGRAIWQLEDADELVAAWIETPDHIAGAVEAAFLRRFKELHGGYPFANWRG